MSSFRVFSAPVVIVVDSCHKLAPLDVDTNDMSSSEAQGKAGNKGRRLHRLGTWG